MIDNWCHLSDAQVVSRGNYYLSLLQTKSNQPLHLETVFMGSLATFLMDRYEGYRGATPQASVSNGKSAKRTKKFYRRLFDQDGLLTLEFRTWASESLALWIESGIGQSIHAEGGSPNDNDPAFDIVSIIKDEGFHKLKVTQVKASEDRSVNNAGEALRKFELLEAGYYDAELSTRLEVIRIRSDFPLKMSDLEMAEMLFDPDRRYCVTLVHGDDLSNSSPMTEFGNKVTGDIRRRSAVTVMVDWTEFWNMLGRVVYDQLD